MVDRSAQRRQLGVRQRAVNLGQGLPGKARKDEDSRAVDSEVVDYDGDWNVDMFANKFDYAAFCGANEDAHLDVHATIEPLRFALLYPAFIALANEATPKPEARPLRNDF